MTDVSSRLDSVDSGATTPAGTPTSTTQCGSPESSGSPSLGGGPRKAELAKWYRRNQAHSTGSLVDFEDLGAEAFDAGLYIFGPPATVSYHQHDVSRSHSQTRNVHEDLRKHHMIPNIIIFIDTIIYTDLIIAHFIHDHRVTLILDFEHPTSACSPHAPFLPLPFLYSIPPTLAINSHPQPTSPSPSSSPPPPPPYD